MAGKRKRKTIGADEARLLGLLLSGDIAGFEKATGMSMREMELRMRAAGEFGDPGALGDGEFDDDGEFDNDDEEDEEDEDWFDDEEEEDDWRLRPQWLHPDCVDPCNALDLGTCCKYPANRLVHRAVELADFAGRGAAGDPARLLTSVPALLAQIHAVLPGMDRTSAAQLTCPVGRLADALGVNAPVRLADYEPLRPLLAACSDALWAALRTARNQPIAGWTQPHGRSAGPAGGA